MSAQFGIDKLVAEVAEEMGAQMRQANDFYTKRGFWTPIESLFFQAFLARTEILNLREFKIAAYGAQRTEDDAKDILTQSEEGTIRIFPQAQLPSWRVDFLIGVKAENDTGLWMIVECDGHAYHERTKEQAAKDRSRDRRFQAAGYQVFRFTGSELYRAPLKCATEVFDWLVQSYHRESS